MSKQPLSDLYDIIRDVADFPEPGIVFKDVTPLLSNSSAFRAALDLMTETCRAMGPEKILAIESRGFIFGAPIAATLGVGLVLARKAGKLPWKRHRVEYALEYGTDTIEIHQDSIHAGEKVVIVDDVLATGGTARAAGEVVDKAGGIVSGYGFLIELAFLGGRKKISQNGMAIESVLEYR